ncbi:uncharacterized protein LOC143425702 [Xylocopa sonorina]|uniref:uncharacterized protein LOC143425702 n=1 Tax=Xylocopa sonorina TaxID=1818115 RepID=UPI00403AD564
MDVFIADYPYLITGIGVAAKLLNYLLKGTKFKLLLGGIFNDWKNIRSADEVDIMDKYSRKGTFFVRLYMVHIVVILGVFSCVPFVPLILDVIVPLNKTRTRLLVYPVYYFVDQNKYYFPILVHTLCMLVVLACTYCACDMNYIYAVQHACGLVAVSGYMKEIQVIHDTYLFVVVGVLTISISISMLKIVEGEHDEQWWPNCLFFFNQMVHMLFLTAQGQFIANSFDEFYNNVAEALWYNSTTETQALYMLVLRGGLNPPLLSAGGLIMLNLKSFSEIIKASFSYFTVMQSK